MASHQDFYLHCAKELTLKLKNVKDRALASAWIIRLETDTEISIAKRNLYSKFLVYVLQRGSLTGPFSQHPNNFKTLSDLPEDQDLLQVSSLNRRLLNERRAEEFVSDFSGDLRTYVAYQPINNFGMHCYYAMSKRPVNEWERFDQSIFPVGTNPGGIIGGLNVDDNTSRPRRDSEVDKKKADFADKLQKKAKASRKVAFTSESIGRVKPKPDEMDDRIPPSWGSNLIAVKEIIKDQ